MRIPTRPIEHTKVRAWLVGAPGERTFTVGRSECGAMEFGFSAIMQDVLPVDVMAAALIWWRFYSYYIYVLLGAFAAGRTVMRALNSGSEPRVVTSE